VFVHADDPPRLQARVVVELELAFAGTKARLEGEVVQHVPASAGTGAGVGVELLAPLAKIREGLGRFAEPGAGAAPSGPPAAAARPGAPARTAAAPAAKPPEVQAPAAADGLFDDDDLFEPVEDAASPASAPPAADAIADDDALDLGDPLDAPAASAGGDDDLNEISDADLAAALEEVAPEAARPAPAAPASTPEAPATRTLAPQPLDPNDPLASLDPGALVLSDDDPEPEAAPEALPPDGVPFDPHERELP
jgi:hypothetical protein